MKALLSFLWLLIVVCTVYAEPPLSVDEIMSLAKMNVITPEMVDPAIRDEVVVQLRAKLRSDDVTIPVDVSISLILLGDEETIAKWMKASKAAQLKEGKNKSIGSDGLPVQPLLIPYLAEDFFRDDGEEWTATIIDDQMVLSEPISIGSIMAVLSLLRRSPAFSPEVKTWLYSAKGRFLYSNLDMLKLRNLMRQWWRENEGHFAAKDYAAVKPGASLAGVLKFDSLEALAASRKTLKAAAPTAPEPSTPAPTTPTPNTAVIATTQSSPYLIPAAVGLSAMAMAAAFFLWRKKSG
jgi:hypothetical protein